MRSCGLLLLFLAGIACAQRRPDALQPRLDTAARKGIVIGAHLCASMTPSAAAAFTAMRTTLGTGAGAFPAMTGLGGSVTIDLSPVFSVLLQAQAFNLTLDDAGNYVVKDTTSGAVLVFAQSADRWSVQTFPFLAGVRFTPIPSRFQSYGVALAGFAVTHVRWDHTTSLTSDPNRFPSATFEATTLAPTVALGVGLELVFDQFHRGELLRGITLEARYRWTESTYDIFGPIASHSTAPASEWRQSYPMNFSGFELLMGLHMQFFR